MVDRDLASDPANIRISGMKSESGSLCSSSSRILYDVPCKVCGDYSSGKHYGIFACDGCAGFFKRSIRRGREYMCKSRDGGSCKVDKMHRNQCRGCRLNRCIEVGMNKEAVQHERGPRSATIRRQIEQIQIETSKYQPYLPLSPVSSPHASPSFFQPSRSPPAPLRFSPFFSSPAPLTPPPSNPNNPADICESAARVLFMNSSWPATLSSFTCLSKETQEHLFSDSWLQLFLLGCSEFISAADISCLISADSTLSLSKVQELRDLQDLLMNLRALNLDPTEIACIRALLLFKSNPEIQSTLATYVTMRRPDQPLRFGSILLLLSALSQVQSSTVHQLFFRTTIGEDVPIDKVVVDMFKKTQL